MAGVSEKTLGELREVSRIPGMDIPLPKSPIYSVLLSTFPVLVRTMFRIRYRGVHRLPRKGPMILAANHTSHIDPFTVIGGARRRTHYLSKDTHFDNFMTAFVMNTTGQIRTERESGAADALSLRIGNLLVGNPEEFAGLEMTILGGTFQFESDAFIAVSGSQFDILLDGKTFDHH